MAQIKFKYENEWRNLEIPVRLFGYEFECVEITGTDTATAFPDLSPYISDLSQIKLLKWAEYRRTTNSDNSSGTGTGTTWSLTGKSYLYEPEVSELVFRDYFYTSQSGVADFEQSTYTLTGTPSAILVNGNAAKFSGTLYLYYYPKEA